METSQVISPPAANLTQTLFILRNADMTLTSDQAFTKFFQGTNYVVTGITAVRKSGAFGVACVGGIYTGSAKAGDVILSAAQAYVGLTGVGTVTMAPVANLISKSETATPNLSLTSGNTGALSADFFITGVVVD